jgi:hypothetical protein
VWSLSGGKFLPTRFSFFDAVGSRGYAADFDFLFGNCAVFPVMARDGFAVAVAAGGDAHQDGIRTGWKDDAAAWVEGDGVNFCAAWFGFATVLKCDLRCVERIVEAIELATADRKACFERAPTTLLNCLADLTIEGIWP